MCSCVVEWEGEDSDGDLWEESWVNITHLSTSQRTYAKRRGSSRASFLARVGRRPLAGEPRGETRYVRDRRERGATINGARDYEIGREGRLRNPAALEPQPGADVNDAFPHN